MKITMRFWRDVYGGFASLEYSWVPEGLRHVIKLTPGQQEADRTDNVSGDLYSHVQVYCLDNNKKTSTLMWQFPQGPPHKFSIIHAAIEVFQSRMVGRGTVYYADGSSMSEEHRLDDRPRRCPEEPQP